ncbi:type II toxin-antitoxin system RelB/DinJ family antitoxin [Sporolactobacillus vineae]|uniref:type II toxin-antitoxin system RelB/DinJ family antitoxin n=1 Tax=Sporolactobacillus vineae TaxID=444463 RepID=UPI000289F9F5|nr:type II toxin-antitoxin system RelB/DinJ family antitoxin [Sporolactobacillus vineae]
MATKNITIRMDEDLKKHAEQVFKDMGLNMTTAITIFTKAVVLQKRIPFEITADPFYRLANQEHLRKSITDLDHHHGQSHDLIEGQNE